MYVGSLIFVGTSLNDEDMLNKCFCATCIGVEAVVVTVEVDLSVGIGIHLVGLPDSAVRESLLRVVTALTSYGFRIPGRKLVVNLAPADIRKEGSAYDLAIALGLLAVSEQVRLVDCEKFVIMGELALDGRIRPVNGVLPVALKAREEGFAGCIFPAESAAEASEVEGLAVYGVSTLAETIEILTKRGDCDHLRVRRESCPEEVATACNDFRQVRGQHLAKRGLEIAAAGGHNLILVGSPGSGKSLMASCLPSILPPMTRDEAIETGKVYSVAGRGAQVRGLMRVRPFRSPHHSASLVSLIGGGPQAGPGEISLAHNGVLYLDEMAQFSRGMLDALRQPLEDGKVTISRARYKVVYPAHFMLVASMNPCPCGYYGDEAGHCTCSRGAIESYLSRISGPMMDRIDIQIWVRSLSAVELLGLSGKDGPGSDSCTCGAGTSRTGGTFSRGGYLYQRGDGGAAHRAFLSAFGCVPPNARKDSRPDGPVRPRLHPHTESGPHDRRPCRRGRHPTCPSSGSRRLPLPRPAPSHRLKSGSVSACFCSGRRGRSPGSGRWRCVGGCGCFRSRSPITCVRYGG